MLKIIVLFPLVLLPACLKLVLLMAETWENVEHARCSCSCQVVIISRQTIELEKIRIIWNNRGREKITGTGLARWPWREGLKKKGRERKNNNIKAFFLRNKGIDTKLHISLEYMRFFASWKVIMTIITQKIIKLLQKRFPNDQIFFRKNSHGWRRKEEKGRIII